MILLEIKLFLEKLKFIIYFLCNLLIILYKRGI